MWEIFCTHRLEWENEFTTKDVVLHEIRIENFEATNQYQKEIHLKSERY